VKPRITQEANCCFSVVQPGCETRRTKGERACRRCPLAADCHLRRRDAEIKRHLPLARYVAHRYLRSAGCRGGSDVGDLESVASLELIRSIDGFEPERGHRFSSFAVPMITGAIRHDQRDRWQRLHLPRRALELQQRVIGVQRRRQAAGEPLLQPGELCVLLGCTLEHLHLASDAWRQQQVLSLDGTGEGALSQPQVEAPDDPTVLWLRQQLQALAPADQALIEGVWIEPVPRRQLASRLGLSLRQLAARAEQLKDQLRQRAMASKAAMEV